MIKENLAGFFLECYKRVPAVKKMFDDVEIRPQEINNVQDLSRLPVTPKSELVNMQKDSSSLGGFLSGGLSDLKRLFMSPGPIYDPEGNKEDYWRWSPALKAAGFGPQDVVQNTFSYHFTPAGMMFDAGLRELGCTVVPTGVGNNEQQVQVMHDLNVTGFVGIPSYLRALIDKAREMGFSFPDNFKLEKAFFTAEMLPNSLRKEFSSMGIDAYQGYGTADLGCIAFECSYKEGMHLGDGVIVEIVNPETGMQVEAGEVGELVVTLLDITYPLIRFATGDLSMIIPEACSCDNSSLRIKGVLGRVGDAVKVRGLFVHGSQIKEAVNPFPDVLNYQAVVSRNDYKDELTLQVEIDPHETLDPEKIATKLKESTRLNCDVKIVPIGSIAEDDVIIKDIRTWD